MSGLAAVYGEEADPDLVVEMLNTIAYRDVKNARLVAEYLETDHYELVLGLDEILAVLPKVIYYLESFDPSLVRSSVAFPGPPGKKVTKFSCPGKGAMRLSVVISI